MVPAAFGDFVRAEAGGRAKIPGELVLQRNVEVTLDIFECSVISKTLLNKTVCVADLSYMGLPSQKHFSSTYNGVITGDRAKTYRGE